MPYLNVFADNFNRADTVVGAAKSTTAVGSAFKDYHGGNYNVASNHLLASGTSGDFTNDVGYWSGQAVRVGRVTFTVLNGSIGGVGRFDDTDGSGYFSLDYGQQVIFGRKSPGGTSYDLFQIVTLSTYTRPATPLFRFEVQDTDATTVTLVWTAYDPAAPSVALASASYVDSASTLKRSGFYGVTNYGGGSVLDDLSIDAFAISLPVPGTITLDTASLTKTRLTAAATTGGSGSGYTLKWQRSTTSTTAGFTDVAGATATTLNDTGLSPGTTYYYRTVVSDGAGATATSDAVTVRTAAAGATMVGAAGDSITQRYYASTQDLCAASLMPVFLTGAGRAAGVCNRGFAGITSGGWASGAAATIADMLYFEVSVLQIMLGTNDSLAGVTKAAFKANIASIIATAKTAGILKIILHESPAVGPQFTPQNGMVTVSTANGLLLQYRDALSELSDGQSVFRGSTGTFSYFQANSALLTDGVHPNDTGHESLGAQWAIANERALTLAAHTYTAAANVRSGTDRGDGILGTLVVPPAADVLVGTVFDNGTQGSLVPIGATIQEVTQDVQIDAGTAGMLTWSSQGLNPADLPTLTVYRDTFPTTTELFQVVATVVDESVNVTYAPGQTSTPGRYRYQLVVNDAVLASGLFVILG